MSARESMTFVQNIKTALPQNRTNDVYVNIIQYKLHLQCLAQSLRNISTAIKGRSAFPKIRGIDLLERFYLGFFSPTFPPNSEGGLFYPTYEG